MLQIALTEGLVYSISHSSMNLAVSCAYLMGFFMVTSYGADVSDIYAYVAHLYKLNLKIL